MGSLNTETRSKNIFILYVLYSVSQNYKKKTNRYFNIFAYQLHFHTVARVIATNLHCFHVSAIRWNDLFGERSTHFPSRNDFIFTFHWATDETSPFVLSPLHRIFWSWSCKGNFTEKKKNNQTVNFTFYDWKILIGRKEYTLLKFEVADVS